MTENFIIGYFSSFYLHRGVPALLKSHQKGC